MLPVCEYQGDAEQRSSSDFSTRGFSGFSGSPDPGLFSQKNCASFFAVQTHERTQLTRSDRVMNLLGPIWK